jgi:uncharacterized protein (DUF2252 family)
VVKAARVAEPSDPTAPLPTHDELVGRGRAARQAVPIASLGSWRSADRRSDPVDLIAEQATTRIPELVPVRHGRMAVSPATFYRGAALPMAADLVTQPTTGLIVQLGGDAHLSNFGLFASPERDLLFDMNDFDETHPGPFEWDVKRLAASCVVAARGRDFSAHDAKHVALDAIRSYRERMVGYAEMSALEIYYSRVDVVEVMDFVDKRARPYLASTVKAATHHDALAAFEKLTVIDDTGRRRLVDRPPTMVHSPLVEQAGPLEALRRYRATLQEDRRQLLDRFGYVDAAIKVVGVGSVGLGAVIVLMLEAASQAPLFLQVKEAEASVLERFLTRSPFANHGERVVAGQRRLQAASDILLGWTKGSAGRHVYVRQLHDQKGSAVLEAMTAHDLRAWAALCGWALARGHARSGDPASIAAYLGDDDAFDHAIGDFAVAYADQTDADYAAFVAAIKSGRLVATSGV